MQPACAPAGTTRRWMSMTARNPSNDHEHPTWRCRDGGLALQRPHREQEAARPRRAGRCLQWPFVAGPARRHARLPVTRGFHSIAIRRWGHPTWKASAMIRRVLVVAAFLVAVVGLG